MFLVARAGDGRLIGWGAGGLGALIARTVPDYAATKAAVGPKRTIHGVAGIAEFRGAERILNAALQHLQDFRTDSYTSAELDQENQP